MHTLPTKLLPRILLASVISVFISATAAAEILRFNEEMSLNVNRTGTWVVEAGRPPTPAFPFNTINLRPRDERNAEVLISVMAKNDPQALSPDFMKEVLIGDCTPWVAHSADKKMPEIQRLTTAHIKGLYASFIDPDLVGKPPKKRDYKVTAVFMLAIDNIYMAKVTFLYDEKASSEYREGMLMIQSLSAK